MGNTLVTPTKIGRLEQDIAVQSQAEPIHKMRRKVSSSPVPRRKNPFHFQLRQNADEFPAGESLRLWTRPEKRARSALESCENAAVTTYILDDGSVFHRVGFELRHWRDNAVKWTLPKETRVVAVKVHDRWLNRLATDENDGARITLPYDSNLASARYEILLRQDSAPWPFGMRVPLPVIDWPMKPLGLRTRVHMQSDWMPLSTSGLAPVGVPAAIAHRSRTLSVLERIWRYGQGIWPTSESSERTEKLDQQRQAVLSAEAQMRRAAGPKSLKLGEVLDRFTAQHLKDAAPLVIDAVAMNALGLSGATVVPAADLRPDAPRPFWERFGLVYVPTVNAALLTSSTRIRTLDIEDYGSNIDCNDALHEAILNGRDDSGGFLLVTTWLNLPFESTADSASFPFQSRVANWRSADEWEVVAPEQPATLYLINLRSLRLLGDHRMHWIADLAVPFDGIRFARCAPESLCLPVLLPSSAGRCGEYIVLPTLFVVLASVSIMVLRLARTAARRRSFLAKRRLSKQPRRRVARHSSCGSVEFGQPPGGASIPFSSSKVKHRRSS